MACYIGLDLGGTNIKAGIVSDDARVLASDSVPTGAQEGVESVIEALAAAARSVVAAAGVAMPDVAGIGVGSAGVIDFEHGLVVGSPNLPGFNNLPLRDRLAEVLQRPVTLENDANAAAMGEFWVGAGKDSSVQHLIMLTLGTGIGSGIIIDGRVLHGAFGSGGEAGHMIVEPEGRLCGCGQHGCVEQYASASAVARAATEALARGEVSSQLSGSETVSRTLTAAQVFDAARQGDALCTRIVDQAADYLGLACVNLYRVLDAQMVVFAGGMAEAGDFLLDRVRAAFVRRNWTIQEPRLRIVAAELGNRIGMIGAAAVARAAATDRRKVR